MNQLYLFEKQDRNQIYALSYIDENQVLLAFQGDEYLKVFDYAKNEFIKQFPFPIKGEKAFKLIALSEVVREDMIDSKTQKRNGLITQAYPSK